MKIGILTFHCVHNYGAVLQAYCLQEELKSYGHDVYILNYRPPYLTKGIYRFSLRCLISKSFKGFIRKWTNEPFLIKSRIKRYNNFEKFINSQLRLCTYDEEEIEKTFDVIVYGSDQIWNIEITGGTFDEVYWGLRSNLRLVSYAASTRNLPSNNGAKSFIVKALNRFSAISVREKSLADKLKELTNLDVKTVLDPTLLSGNITLKKFLKDNRQQKPYIFIYELSHHEETTRIANLIAQQMHFDIIELEGDFSARRFFQKDMSASPEDFINYIANAACVITTSFHGTALSLLFNKTFYAIRQYTSADGRIEAVLSSVGLLSRLIPKGRNVSFEQIDYTEVNQRMEILRSYSRDFLYSSIQ